MRVYLIYGGRVNYNAIATTVCVLLSLPIDRSTLFSITEIRFSQLCVVSVNFTIAFISCAD